MDNHTYDLVKALTEKADAVTIYDQYMADSKDCSECQQMWQELKQEDNRHLDKLKEILSTHAKNGTIK